MTVNKEIMTSRKRVLCAFARVPADRVPIDYLTNPGIERSEQGDEVCAGWTGRGQSGTGRWSRGFCSP
jgi:hypothetical protein